MRYLRLFRYQHLLDEMLGKRREGWSFPALAKEFNCDVSTIYAQCKKYGVVGRVELTVKLTHPPTVPKHLYADFNGELTVRPKSYKEYIYAQKERERLQFNERIRGRIQKQRESKAV